MVAAALLIGLDATLKLAAGQCFRRSLRYSIAVGSATSFTTRINIILGRSLLSMELLGAMRQRAAQHRFWMPRSCSAALMHFAKRPLHFVKRFHKFQERDFSVNVGLRYAIFLIRFCSCQVHRVQRCSKARTAACFRNIEHDADTHLQQLPHPGKDVG